MALGLSHITRCTPTPAGCCAPAHSSTQRNPPPAGDAQGGCLPASQRATRARPALPEGAAREEHPPSGPGLPGAGCWAGGGILSPASQAPREAAPAKEALLQVHKPSGPGATCPGLGSGALGFTAGAWSDLLPHPADLPTRRTRALGGAGAPSCSFAPSSLSTLSRGPAHSGRSENQLELKTDLLRL